MFAYMYCSYYLLLLLFYKQCFCPWPLQLGLQQTRPVMRTTYLNDEGVLKVTAHC